MVVKNKLALLLRKLSHVMGLVLAVLNNQHNNNNINHLLVSECQTDQNERILSKGNTFCCFSFSSFFFTTLLSHSSLFSFYFFVTFVSFFFPSIFPFISTSFTSFFLFFSFFSLTSFILSSSLVLPRNFSPSPFLHSPNLPFPFTFVLQ